jgi:hypothetical protein
MLTNKVFLSLTILSTMLFHYCHGMEAELSLVIPLNEGITTIIPGVISNTYYDLLTQRRLIRNTLAETATLIDLINKKGTISKSYTPEQLFCPIVFKISETFIENLGRLDKIKHREALGAICQKKALYYPREQGAIVYSSNTQPDPTAVITLKGLLEKIIKQEIK